MLVTLAFGIGTHEIILIIALAVLLFGATKLPQLGSAVGQSIKNLKRGMREAKEEEDNAQKSDEPKKLDNPDSTSDSTK